MLKSILDVGRDHRRVATILFGYLFREFDKFEYRRRIGDKEVQEAVWERVKNNGYVLRNCKLFAYAVHYNRGRHMPTSPAKFGIMQDDVAVLRSLDLGHIPIKYKAYSLFDFDNLEGSILGSEELQTNLGKFVSKKLIFLDRHFGEPRDEIEQQLRMAAVYALRKQYPYYHSDEHALNVCKTALKNKGHGLIEYHTRGKRNKLLNEKGTFQAVNVSFESGIEAVTSLSVQPEHENEHKLNMQALDALDVRMDSKVKAFIKIARGQYDSGFSMFIGVDNEDAAEAWDYNRYLTQVRDYLNITEEQATKLMLRLRKSIL